MSDKPWKAEERRVAAMFGTERALMKGTQEKSDIQILTVREPGKKLRLAVIELDYLISIMKGASVLETDTEATGGR